MTEPTVTTMYRIKNLDNGLYSSGGTYPSWTPKGKIWRQKNHLTCHLSLCPGKYRGNIVVEAIEVIEIVVLQEPLTTFVAEATARKEKREASEKIKRERQRIEWLERNVQNAKRELELAEKKKNQAIDKLNK